MKLIALTFVGFLSSGLPNASLAAAVQEAGRAGDRATRQPQTWQTTDEGRQWIRAVSTRLQNHTPAALLFNRGAVTVLFRVDREGKIFDVRVTPESPKEAAALLLWIFDVVHLPPPPPAAMRQGCCALSQTFNLGRPLTP